MNQDRLRFRWRAPLALVALLSMLVIISFAVRHVIGGNAFVVEVKEQLESGGAPLRHAFGTIGDDLGSWSRAVGHDGKPRPDAVFREQTIEALGTDLYLDRLLSDGDRQINVHVAYYTGMIDTVPHVPERSWDGAGISKSIGPQVVDLDLEFDGVTIAGSPVNPATGDPYPVVEVLELGRPVPVHLPVGTPEMMITQFDTDSRNPAGKQVAGYFFIVDGRLTPNRKELAKKDRYFCKVQLAYSGTRQDGEGSYAVFAEFVEIAEDLLPSLLPEIMHCLPDSPGIEGSAGPVEATRPQRMIPRSNGDRSPNS